MSYPLALPPATPLITLTKSSATLWLIELHNGDDSRLSRTLINEGLMPALDAVEMDWRGRRKMAGTKGMDVDAGGALVIVGKRGQNKFFSNGLDYASASQEPDFVQAVLNPLYLRVLTFPIPTVAAINGHSFAGAMILSLACDYRVMTDGSQRPAWMCLNEIRLGAVFPKAISALLRAKCHDAHTLRRMALEGHRFTPQEGLEAGLVDKLVRGDTEAVLAEAMIVARTTAPFAREGVWGLIKENVYAEVLAASRDEHSPFTLQNLARARL